MFDQMKGGMFQGRVRRDAFISVWAVERGLIQQTFIVLDCWLRVLRGKLRLQCSASQFAGGPFWLEESFFEGHESCFLTQVR